MLVKTIRFSAALALSCVLSAVAQAQEGTLKGVVTVSGPRPKITNLFVDIKTDAKCAEQYTEAKPQVKTPNILTAKIDGKEDSSLLQNAIVYINSNFGGKKFDVPTTPKTIDQKGCMYVPHVLTIQVDQKLDILNSDPLSHNIHGLPTVNKEFNYGQSQKGMHNEEVFKKPEIFKVKCDVHKWMSAWIGVFTHPYHTVTNEKGEYEIKGLPAGEYEVVFWHEVLGEHKEKITIASGDNSKDYAFKQEAGG